MANGYLLFDGFSRLDGGRVMVIATGFGAKSHNAKTGAMIQTYILRADIDPVAALKIGADGSICGTCMHRGDGTGKGRTCYVNVGQGPLAVYKAHDRGLGYPMLPVADYSVFAGRMVRFGTYGDPAAVPSDIWADIAWHAAGWTGYTHQWRQPWAAAYRAYCMASVDSMQEAVEARRAGWRTFRVSAPGDLSKVGRESLCPASEDAGKKVNCLACRACSGTGGRGTGNIMIPAHGGFAVMANIKRREAA